jgi:mono/diheme cytochrome c family protein
MIPPWQQRAERLVAAAVALTAATTALCVEVPGYNRDIRPILAENCFACHGPDAKQRQADLRLDRRDAAITMLAPGNPDASEVLRRIATDDPEDRMPPAETHKTLSEAQKGTLRAWIADGAPYERHWSFIPFQRPELPSVANANWSRNELDVFILDRLEQEGLSPAPRADRPTLIRRITLDLTGLPPTPEEVAAFENDYATDAYEKVVDRLLASPRYGEHMALEWLEAARYADTDGYQNDRLRYHHVWRDWVIEAMNQNLPWDEFVVQQLAGDMLPDATLRQQIATGFNRNHRINSENGSIPEEWHVENVVDRVDTLGTVFLGLTVSCARCHDHKYDPISQREYYELFAQFNNVPEWGVGPNNGNSPPWIPVPKTWPALAPEEDRLIPPAPLNFIDRKAPMLRPLPGGENTVMVMAELPEPRPTHLLQRGLYNAPDTSEALSPSAPRALIAEGIAPPRNRLELARWLVHPSNPLTARVAVNRQWQHFFGRGLVRTSENFGLQGEFPSHPELLDWLATEFIALDWDVKAFQKMIVMSATYCQSSQVSREGAARDPENQLFSRAPRIRLTGSQLRDQALFASGLLAEQIGGPSVKPYMPPGLWESISNATYDQGCGQDLYRRSLYTYWRRTTPPPMLTGFNGANREVCAVRNELANTPLQALTLMNNVVFVEAARLLAQRMLDSGSVRAGQLAEGFRRVLSREPEAAELDDLLHAFEGFQDAFAQNHEAARELLMTGERLSLARYEQVELASMTMAASVILNLDEAIVRN